MKIFKNEQSRLSLILWAIALHSFFVGLGLITQPPVVMKLFGFKSCGEHFFPAQGGVFHIVMAFGYGMAASHPSQNRIMIIFSIWVKAAATVFLLLYFLIVESIWMVLASCIGDGVMGLFIYLAYRSWMNKMENEEDKSFWPEKNIPAE